MFTPGDRLWRTRNIHFGERIPFRKRDSENVKTIEVRNLMKKKMCRWIFKKELNEAYTELNNSYCREVVE